MKTWKKITLGVLIILIGGGVYLYIAGSGDETPGDDRQPTSSPIFPFDSENEDDFFDDQQEDDQTDEAETDPISQTPPQLWKITDSPVAGSGWVDGDIWYVRRDTGHIYRYDPEEREGERISNTTIPQVQEAIISSSGNHVIYRYIGEGDTLRTYIATLTEVNTGQFPYQMDGEFIPNDSADLAFSPDGNELFYIRNNDDIAAGIIYNLRTQNQETVFESSIREWRVGWNTDDGITLFTKPTRDSDGFAYLLDPDDGSLEKITEGAGLTVKVSSGGDYILASSYGENGYETRSSSIDNPESTSLTTKTLSDKCSWVDNESVFFCGVPEDFPRNALKDWYQGTYAYTDQLTLFNADTERQNLLFDDQQLDKGPFDITDISVDDDFRYLQFINQRENALWGYSL